MSSNDILITAYKNMRDLIKATPNDKDKIINEYTDLIQKVNNYNQTKNYDNSDPNIELQNMLKKNPLEINIYNNFQKYNNPNSVPLIPPFSTDTFPNRNINFSQFRTPEESKQYIIDTTTKYDNRR